MSSGRCSAIPAQLVAYARESEDTVALLRGQLRAFEARVHWLFTRVPLYASEDPGWSTAWDLDDLASWVAHVGWAFAVAGAGGDATASFVVRADANAVDHALGRTTWHPSEHLVTGLPNDWMQALNPHCVGSVDRGYRGGSGFIAGPDGLTYPLAAPFVVRDGVEYHADDGVEPGARSVLDLDGLDPGWVTIDERIGVERWRDEPSPLERVLIGVGSTVAGRPNGSTQSDVEELVVQPGRAPSFSSSYEPSPVEALPPEGDEKVGPADGIPLVVEAVGGASLADRGSFAAYDITFQQNADGRRRALYKRVYVGFDDAGTPHADSVWIYGPGANDQALINYAR